MSKDMTHTRRSFLGAAAVSLVTADMALMGPARASVDTPKGSDLGLAPIKQIKADLLDIGYYEAGPSDGPPVLLLHGFPYSIESYVDVAPMLAARGCRVIVPYLRGHGSTRFLDRGTPRSGQQGAIGVDGVHYVNLTGWSLEDSTVVGWPEKILSHPTCGGAPEGHGSRALL